MRYGADSDEAIVLHEDVLTFRSVPAGLCPVCDAALKEPEYIYDEYGERRYEGATNYWCPACGWEDEERKDDDG